MAFNSDDGDSGAGGSLELAAEGGRGGGASPRRSSG